MNNEYETDEPTTYSSSWPPRVTWLEAKREIERHSLEISELENELGIHTHYKSRDVLAWLGY